MLPMVWHMVYSNTGNVDTLMKLISLPVNSIKTTRVSNYSFYSINSPEIFVQQILYLIKPIHILCHLTAKIFLRILIPYEMVNMP